VWTPPRLSFFGVHKGGSPSTSVSKDNGVERRQVRRALVAAQAAQAEPITPKKEKKFTWDSTPNKQTRAGQEAKEQVSAPEKHQVDLQAGKQVRQKQRAPAVPHHVIQQEMERRRQQERGIEYER
jgi:hypothetical protein